MSKFRTWRPFRTGLNMWYETVWPRRGHRRPYPGWRHASDASRPDADLQPALKPSRVQRGRGVREARTLGPYVDRCLRLRRRRSKGQAHRRVTPRGILLRGMLLLMVLQTRWFPGLNQPGLDVMRSGLDHQVTSFCSADRRHCSKIYSIFFFDT